VRVTVFSERGHGLYKGLHLKAVDLVRLVYLCNKVKNKKRFYDTSKVCLRFYASKGTAVFTAIQFNLFV
jgi:hypothetical protein